MGHECGYVPNDTSHITTGMCSMSIIVPVSAADAWLMHDACIIFTGGGATVKAGGGGATVQRVSRRRKPSIGTKLEI